MLFDVNARLKIEQMSEYGASLSWAFSADHTDPSEVLIKTHNYIKKQAELKRKMDRLFVRPKYSIPPKKYGLIVRIFIYLDKLCLVTHKGKVQCM